jgi:hypothetical protein
MECANDNTPDLPPALLKKCQETGQTPEEVLNAALAVLLAGLAARRPKLVTVDGQKISYTEGVAPPAYLPAKTRSNSGYEI